MTTGSRYRARAAIVLGGLLALGGCGTQQKAVERWTFAKPVSEAGVDLYWEARRNYEAVELVAPAPCAEHRATLLEKGVFNVLKAASTNDPRCPVFPDRWGFILLTLSDGYSDALSRAEMKFNQTIAMTTLAKEDDDDDDEPSDWVPGWIALARVARARGNPAQALDHLDDADAAIARLARAVEQPDEPRKLTFIDGLLGQTTTPEPPATGNAGRLELFLVWINETESWSLDQVALPEIPEVTEARQVAVNPATILQRQRARVALVRALAIHDRDHDDAELERELRSIFDDIDQNFFPARFELARLMRSRGDATGAIAMLRPYLAEEKLKLYEDPVVRLEYARAYADRFAEGGRDADILKAVGELESIRQRNGSWAPMWLELARVAILRSERDQDPRLLLDARNALDQAKAGPCGDAADLARVEARLERVALTLGASS